jgi:POT family proton-dependent oligopeptide transporter
MKTLLVLYMVNYFFWSQERASDLLGWYAALAYGLPVVGGFIADRWLGAKRAVVVGALLLSAGHICMAIENMVAFYTALGLIIAGVGLLKPNVSTQVGALYKPGDPRRDGAFTIFYMGINLGALIGPLLCDWLRVNFGYPFGFGAAGVGMILGLIVYVIGQRILVEFNQDVPEEEGQTGGAARGPTVREHPPHVVRDRIVVLLVVFAFVILFWTAFEQSPNAMLVWADKQTNLRLLSTEPPPVTLDEAIADDSGQEDTGWGEAIGNWFRDPKITSGQTQSFNPFFIITLAPLFAFLWIWLDKRKLQPSTPAKMVLGLVGVVLAFGIMWPAAHFENRPSSAPLSEIPPDLKLDEEGFIYTQEGPEAERVYYGFKRLRYDSDTQTLGLNGVLTDLDRFRLLAVTAPDDLVTEVEAFAEQTAGTHEETITTRLEHMPEGLGPIEIKQGEGRRRETILSWDPETNVLAALDEINERARTEFLARAAQPEFKQAVDKIYLEASEFRVSVWWLIGFYLLLTMGELCLSPVGLSLVTKLAPAKHVGLFMGGWFLATAIAEKLAQVFGAYWGKMPPINYFWIFIIMCAIGAVLMALLVRPLKRMMHGVQ